MSFLNPLFNVLLPFFIFRASSRYSRRRAIVTPLSCKEFTKIDNDTRSHYMNPFIFLQASWFSAICCFWGGVGWITRKPQTNSNPVSQFCSGTQSSRGRTVSRDLLVLLRVLDLLIMLKFKTIIIIISERVSFVLEWHLLLWPEEGWAGWYLTQQSPDSPPTASALLYVRPQTAQITKSSPWCAN